MITPLEVKYKEEISLREIKSLLIFARKFKLDQAILVSKAFEKKEKIVNGVTLSELPIYLV